MKKRTLNIIIFAAILIATVTTGFFATQLITNANNKTFTAAEASVAAMNAVTAQYGDSPDIQCLDEIPARVGSNIKCTFREESGRKYNLILTVEALDENGDPKFSFKSQPAE